MEKQKENMSRNRLANMAQGIKGERIDGQANDFMECPDCGQMFDKRDLGQVMHHAFGPHEPMTFTQ